MAREKTIMELQDILKRLKAGHTIKQITRETGTHRSVIRKLKHIALNTDWLRKDALLPSEKELHDAYYGAFKPTSHVLDAFRDELMEYHTSDVSYTVMHQLLQGRTTVSESTLRRYELIAEHQRATKPRQCIDNPDHLGARARAYLEFTRENLLARARAIGESVYELACLVFSDPAVARERFVHGLITLSRKYGSSRVDAACRRALDFDAPRYDVVKRILENGLDAVTRTTPVDSHGQRLFAFARTPGYFAASSHTREEHP